MSDKKYIGVFDSGIGGVTVLDSILKLLPNENIVYLGDSKHLPYGEKTKEQIQSYVLENVKFLSSFDLKALVIACGTADSNARNVVEEKYCLPIYGVVDPVSKLAAEQTKNNKIGVIATAATIASNEYKKHITFYNPNALVYQVACPKFVPIIEEERIDEKQTEEVIKQYLQVLKDENIDTLILGCTHYPLLKDKIQTFLKDVNIVSLSDACALQVKEELEKNNMLNLDEGTRKYFVTSDPQGFKRKIKIFNFNQENIEVELVK